mmetsp:Transcript_37795/g.52483  ORF Transcript_37795/g.52483 Transcript_37795/m.52483 type:complete len:209 (+) Transcript_37795:132-758(+)|eukprot:CAMPEP_0196581190 /NCGR_PEP_ID=MMETSP1081-20130531/32867_1 /TAXON_ID=36882 /ORGANISM="Pyramimonas amylifera, Strain CCMP720" /LENGTH=208 /DNA_ID=CAMNT_0041901321 /DNA_START=124 /DNA_END=750 /DNA_ORIENTATION=-
MHVLRSTTQISTSGDGYFPHSSISSVLSKRQKLVPQKRLATFRGPVANLKRVEMQEARKIVDDCALKRKGDAKEVIKAMENLEEMHNEVIVPFEFNGRWELVFSSSIANVPFLNGFMPVKEIVTFSKVNEPGGFIRLDTDVLGIMSFSRLPGDVLEWDGAKEKLSFNLRSKDGEAPSSVKSWTFFHAEGDVLAARSSGTGLNLLRRVD